MNLYFVQNTEILSSVLETNEATLTQEEIDKLLAFSEGNKAETPRCLHLAMLGNNIVLERTSDIVTDGLYLQKVPQHFKEKWPGVLRGISCSPGLTIGDCTHLTHLNQDVKGKIVISAKLTVKDLSGLQGLKGLILENGSVLSHVGVLAREKKIPCVMGLKDASQIPEGTTIKLDAINGTVSPAL